MFWENLGTMTKGVFAPMTKCHHRKQLRFPHSHGFWSEAIAKRNKHHNVKAFVMGYNVKRRTSLYHVETTYLGSWGKIQMTTVYYSYQDM